MGHAGWSDLLVDGPWSGPLTLQDVLDRDVRAVRRVDSFEYRYYPEGRFTWFSRTDGSELPVQDRFALPQKGWAHLPGCICANCAP